MTSDDILILIIICAIVLITLYYIFGDKRRPIHNDGSLPSPKNYETYPQSSSEADSKATSSASESSASGAAAAVSVQLAPDSDASFSEDDSTATIGTRASGGHKAPIVNGEKPSPSKYRRVSYKDIDSYRGIQRP